MIENNIPVTITNAVSAPEQSVINVHALTNIGQVARFLTKMEFFDKDENGGTWSCSFLLKYHKIETKNIRMKPFRDRPEIKVIHTPQAVEIEMFPDPQMWEHCGCQSYADCPQRVVSGECPHHFIKDTFLDFFVEQNNQK